MFVTHPSPGSMARLPAPSQACTGSFRGTLTRSPAWDDPAWEGKRLVPKCHHLEPGDLCGDNRLGHVQLTKLHVQSHHCRYGCQKAGARDQGASVLSQILTVVLYQGPRPFSLTAHHLAIAGTHFCAVRL